MEKLRECFCKKGAQLPDIPDDGLETVEEYYQRWRSIRVIYFTMFLMSLGFTVVLTGIWPFLDKVNKKLQVENSGVPLIHKLMGILFLFLLLYCTQLDPSAGKEFMGYVVASNPLGQMIFSPIFGYWGNKIKSVRIPLLCSIAIFTLSSAVYSSLELFPTEMVKYWMLLSRFLVGVGSGTYNTTKFIVTSIYKCYLISFLI